MAKKTLLSEQRVARFMQLAGNQNYTQRFLKESLEEMGIEEDEAEEGMMYTEAEGDEPVDEPEAADALEDDPGMEDPGMEDPGEEMGDEPEGDEPEVDVTVDEEQIAALRTAVEVLQDIIDASEGEEGEEDPGMEEPGMEEPGMEDPGMEDPGMEEPGDMAAADEPEEEEEPIAESVDRITKSVLNRVTRRLVKEALSK